ncbi:MAG: ribosome-associated protein [Vicingaceae bacterium]|jgi:ribosome-associated protein
MAKAKKRLNADELAGLIVKGIQEKKGENIVTLDLRGLDGAVTDYYVVCEANSTTQVGAIADSIEKEVREACGEKAWHVEGTENLEWVLVDYVNVVAHIFQSEKREFFNIEELWADAKIKEIRAEY